MHFDNMANLKYLLLTPNFLKKKIIHHFIDCFILLDILKKNKTNFLYQKTKIRSKNVLKSVFV